MQKDLFNYKVNIQIKILLVAEKGTMVLVRLECLELIMLLGG